MVRPRGDGRGQKRGDRCRPEGQTLGEWLDRAIRQSIKAERAGSWRRPSKPACGLVKTMQAQNARLEAVEARRGLFGALWPPEGP